MLFALRQLCTNDWQTKQRVGKYVIKTLIADLRETTSSDFIINGLYLLQVGWVAGGRHFQGVYVCCGWMDGWTQTLATYKENCVEMNAANIKVYHKQRAHKHTFVNVRALCRVSMCTNRSVWSTYRRRRVSISL